MELGNYDCLDYNSDEHREIALELIGIQKHILIHQARAEMKEETRMVPIFLLKCGMDGSSLDWNVENGREAFENKFKVQKFCFGQLKFEMTH